MQQSAFSLAAYMADSFSLAGNMDEAGNSDFSLADTD